MDPKKEDIHDIEQTDNTINIVVNYCFITILIFHGEPNLFSFFERDVGMTPYDITVLLLFLYCVTK